MVADEAREWLAQNRGRLLVGCAAAVLACLAGSGLLWGWNAWRIAGLRQRVASAVRANFPAFCAAPGDRLLINNALVRSSSSLVNNAMWDVSCQSRDLPAWPWPAMTVNLVTCEVTTPMDISLKWYEVYGHLFINGQRMRVCP